MKREYSQCGMSTEPWAILRRHPQVPEVAQQSVTPGFLRGVRNTASGREAAVQGADGPVLLRFTGAVTCWCGDVAGVLAVASVPSAEREILRRVTVRGHLHATDEGVPALPVQAFEIQRYPFTSRA